MPKKCQTEYSCQQCDFFTSKESNFKNHLLTRKHKILQNTTKKSEKMPIFFCDCGKAYKHHSSLWNHKKQCQIINNKKEEKQDFKPFCIEDAQGNCSNDAREEGILSEKWCKGEILELKNEIFGVKEESIVEKKECNGQKQFLNSHVNDMMLTSKHSIDTEYIIEIIKQNMEFKELMFQQNEKLIEMTSKMCSVTSNSHNNNNNKIFNLQVFLNETCKDAMNITDFVNSIDLQLTDFENIGEQGYINGISNIIIKNLKALDENMRPVHCSDVKRETIYIKHNNQWQKDTNDNFNLKKVIKAIAHKNTKMIPKYREKYPETQISTSKMSDKYNRSIIEALGGPGDNTDEKTEKIIKRIAKEIMISKPQ